MAKMVSGKEVIHLEDVFKLSGPLIHTFVKPIEYDKLYVSLRTPGRGVVVEGPSGIGKTTSVKQALSELGITSTMLSANKAEDLHKITMLSRGEHEGLIIIDDFHRLETKTREEIAQYLKVLADEEKESVKLVIIGINNVGESLVSFAYDLNNRIDMIHFEANDDVDIEELINKGEHALNINISISEEIISAAKGSFYIAQMLCKEACLKKKVLQSQAETNLVDVSFQDICNRIKKELDPQFKEIAIKFATGTRLRPSGRAPYLHLLKWLAESNEWSISLRGQMAIHPLQKGSVSQIVEKGYLEDFMRKNPEFERIIHYDPTTKTITVEDPKFVFYLRKLPWDKFPGDVGYVNFKFDSRYDFALSCENSDRTIAKQLADLLKDNEFEVFYDDDEQHVILGENIESYLRPIYKSQADYVLCLLGPKYPRSVWTQFESKQFKARFSKGKVIPIWFSTTPPGIFDTSRKVSGLTLDLEKDIGKQLRKFVEILKKKKAEIE